MIVQQPKMPPPLPGGPSPVVMQHLTGLGIDDVDNDASVPPASLKQVVVLVALSWVEGLVEERPRQLLFPMNLESPSGPHANVLSPKVAVLLITVIQSKVSENYKCPE